jgi:hypothetical protein
MQNDNLKFKSIKILNFKFFLQRCLPAGRQACPPLEGILLRRKNPKIKTNINILILQFTFTETTPALMNLKPLIHQNLQRLFIVKSVIIKK